jgi:hypothetical protein
LLAVLVTIALLAGGCGHLNDGAQARAVFAEANALSSQGDYQASLHKYAQIIAQYPATGDRVLFEMGIIHAHPKNAHKDYPQALECFRRLIADYPASDYRQDSEMMSFYIDNVLVKDQTIAAQQAQIEALRLEVEGRENEIGTLQDKLAALEEKIFTLAGQLGPAERILVEKGERRLTLYLKGEVFKSYKIALGGNPVGPKERQGDHKTPEGNYFVDAKNRNSEYHLSLHLSYPNEKDRQRARELGVSPGGDIMIHGIKNGFAWVGDAHAEVDWTKGCIAVTDEEIEEIDKLTPVGTPVEIRP